MSKIAIALEGLNLSQHSLAISAYTFIENLTKTQHELSLITTYHRDANPTYQFSKVQILQPITKWNIFSSVKVLPLLYSLNPDVLLIMAPFSSPKPTQAYNLFHLAKIAKTVFKTKIYFMGYDPSFHQWPKSMLKTIESEFDACFDFFQSYFTNSVSLPFITPHLFLNPLLNPLSNSQKLSVERRLLINSSYHQLLTYPYLISAIEDFLADHSHWKVHLLEGWGKLHKFHQLSQQVSWQKRHQIGQWIVNEEKDSSIADIEFSAILDILPYISENCLWLNSAYSQGIPIISLSHQHRTHLSPIVFQNPDAFIIKNDETSLYEKLLILDQKTSTSPPVANLQNTEIDSCINIFNRVLASERAK